MAVALSIFTLGGAVQLFWAAFDMPVTEAITSVPKHGKIWLELCFLLKLATSES